MAPVEYLSLGETHTKLLDEVEWQMRQMWREEYLSIVKDGEKILDMVKEKFGRKVHKIFSLCPEAEHWMIQRAARWIRYKEKHNDLVYTPAKSDIRALVLRAKTAAAFVQIACHAMRLSYRKNVKHNDRLTFLSCPPNKHLGIICLPAERLRSGGHPNIIHENEWNTKYFNKETFDALLSQGGPRDINTIVDTSHRIGFSSAGLPGCSQMASATLPEPLRGWGNTDSIMQSKRRWKDPRSCCLCHTTGDDDAGTNLPSQCRTDLEDPDMPCRIIERDEGGGALSVCGRLIPMQNGLWVHSACAFWSSEVWENQEDGLIYALDKARYRGSKLKCFGCGRPGATIGCHKTNCSFNYHFPCAKACGAVFTMNQQMFCKKHKSMASDVMNNSSITMEVMKPLKAAAELETSEVDDNLFFRVGSLVVHSLGIINQDHDGFHSNQYITPPGYLATRIFWSYSAPRKRTLYIMKVETCGEKPAFSITAADACNSPIKGRSMSEAYHMLKERVKKTNITVFSNGDLFSTLPMRRLRGKTTFGLNPAQVCLVMDLPFALVFIFSFGNFFDLKMSLFLNYS